MRAFSTMCFLLGLLATGCTPHLPEPRTGRLPEDSPLKQNSEKPRNAIWEDPLSIGTPEIIRILEEEDIEFVSTTHSQAIHIRLKNGQQYAGTYVQEQADRYADNENLFDVLNLVVHIRDKRSAEEVKDWTIACE